MKTDIKSLLSPYLLPYIKVDWQSSPIPSCFIPKFTPGMQANSYFFGHPQWREKYLAKNHRDELFKQRWQAATGSWDHKIVVDIGCGPGNVYACVAGSPKLLIGIDISLGALELAQRVGYVPLLADAHHLPLIDSFADLVVANATLHHCDDMKQVLTEAARLVKLGGLLVTDMDPQASAWQLKGLGRWLRNQKANPLYRCIRGSSYVPADERIARLKTEVHNYQPGDGITLDLYSQVLEPMGFTVQLYPHNHRIGSGVFLGQLGKSPLRIRWVQWLSNINPTTSEAAQSIMCVAKRVFT